MRGRCAGVRGLAASAAEKLSLDLNVCQLGMTKAQHAVLAAERDAIFDAKTAEFSAQREAPV